MKKTTTTKTKAKSGKKMAKSSGAPAQIDARINELGDWRGETLGRIRALIKQAIPDVVNSNLLIITEKGDLVLARPNTNAYTELARFRAIPNYDSSSAFTNVCWNSPAVADGKVYIRSSQFGAMYDLSVPALKLDPPQVAAGSTVNLTVRTVTGGAVNSNRLANMEVRAGTNLSLSPEAWPKLTNQLVLTNGMVVVTNVDGASPHQYFIVAEPK